MTESLRNMPRYIRNTDAFGWQGADGPNGPWRSITPPQSGTPWQAASPMDDLRQTSADVSGVEVLSPATQVVLDAFRSSHTGQGCLAAALRAVADQVVPQGGPFLMTASEDRVRHQLLKIADELQGQGQLTKESV